MTTKYEIHIDNGRVMYRHHGGIAIIEYLKGQLIYDMRNGIIAEVRGTTVEPSAIIETDEDIYNIFFKDTKDGEVISLTDYLAGKITAKRAIRVRNDGYYSVKMHNKECIFTNDHLKGGLSISAETMSKINGICKIYTTERCDEN